MEHNLDQTISLLARTPTALETLLRDLPDAWTLRNEGENTWSAFDIVGHLIHGDRTDWIPRAKRLLEFGESKAFEPFDRWGQDREKQGKSLAQLLDEFARVRSESLRELRALNLRPEDLARRGKHPSLGPVTLAAFRDLGGSRPDASAPDFPRHGSSVPRSCGPVWRLSRRAEVHRPQFALKLLCDTVTACHPERSEGSAFLLPRRRQVPRPLLTAQNRAALPTDLLRVSAGQDPVELAASGRCLASRLPFQREAPPEAHRCPRVSGKT